MAEARQLILASASSARRALLTNAGLSFDVMPANIDEAAIKNASRASDPAIATRAIAGTLAVQKARQVSMQHPKALVIGADQVLSCGDEIHSKASNIAEARTVLRTLRGRQHELISAAALARNGELLWQTESAAQLTMRDFSEAFLEDYLARAGAVILDCVGCYELEGLGIQLFEKIEGDYFTVLGLPLVPLLAEMRRRGELPT